MVGMKYAKFERIVVLVIVITIAVMSAAMIVKKTDAVEVAGHMLMIVVIVSSLYWGKRGALISFILCFGGYAAARLAWPGDFSYGTALQLVISKFLVYGILALLCSYIRNQFRYFFVKLEHEDFIDDETELGNERFLFKELTSRINENERYDIPFSLVQFSFRNRLVEDMRKKYDTNLLRDISISVLKNDTRSVDELSRFGNDLIIVLPSVGRAGATVCAKRLESKMCNYLDQFIHRGEIDDVLSITIYEYPEDKTDFDALISRLDAAVQG
jgi:GGDEF domain-containing protein